MDNRRRVRTPAHPAALHGRASSTSDLEDLATRRGAKRRPRRAASPSFQAPNPAPNPSLEKKNRRFGSQVRAARWDSAGNTNRQIAVTARCVTV